MWAVVTDKRPPALPENWFVGDFDHVIDSEEIGGPAYRAWLFGHDIVEACTAVKAMAMRHILSIENVTGVLYFDPDIALFSRADRLVDSLQKHSVILTPHQVHPERRSDRQAIIDNEIASLANGSYNLGFIGVRNCIEGRRFASWWEDRLEEWCHDRRDIGLFVDQKWCDLVPCLFDDVGILRDSAYNVASWNLSNRSVRITESGNILVNDELLCFFHFTKLGPIGATMTSRYAKGALDVYELWWWYRREVEANRDPRIPHGWWAYSTFEDGEPIQKELRVLYRDRADLKNAFASPFSSGPNSFKEWAAHNL
ncbi:hypothetical protein WDZ92_36415 [Nostoc sp. NIES-2111]